MKKKSLLVLLATITTLSLMACNSKNESHTDEPKQETESTELASIQTTIKEMVELEETNPITETFASQEVTSITTEGTTEPESEVVLSSEENEYQTTDLFEQIYVPYANREKSFVFNGVKSFVSTLEYKIEITEPTEEDLGEIKIIDTNGDYVYLAFLPVNGIQTIMIVSYYRQETDSEVSMSNYSSDGSPLYDKFKTHVIGESDIEVSSTDEQRSFLFKKKLFEQVNESTELIPEHRTGEEIIGISDKDISDLNLKFYESVKNDVTGRWRLAEISEDVDIQDYIYSYYKEYFKDDSELHVIVNHSRNITTSINPVLGELYVVEHNYVDGEEYDAKQLCSHPVIKEYYIYIDNGDIEKIE